MLLSIFVNSIVEILGLALWFQSSAWSSNQRKFLSNDYLKSAFDLAPLGINTPSRFLIALCVS